MMGKVAAADQSLAALSEDEQISKGNTDCYRCPKCQFGPVAHRACSNLALHHGSGGISNKCPKCGFFGRDISEWIPTSSLFFRPVRVVPPLHRDFVGFEFLPGVVVPPPIGKLLDSLKRPEALLSGSFFGGPFSIPLLAENNLCFGNRDNNFHRHCLPKKRQDRIPRFQNTPRSSSRSAHRFGGR